MSRASAMRKHDSEKRADVHSSVTIDIIESTKLFFHYLHLREAYAPRFIMIGSDAEAARLFPGSVVLTIQASPI